MESFPAGSSPKAPEGMMGLFSFLSENGKGCSATISSEQFVVEVISALLFGCNVFRSPYWPQCMFLCD